MDQIIDIGLPTIIICLGVYFIVHLARYAAARVWAATANKYVRGVIKWVGTMWLGIWPIAIGWGMLRFVDGIPVPEMIEGLTDGPPSNAVLGIYGGFCGMISAAVVKAVKGALEKKGISVKTDDPYEAAAMAKQARVDKTIAKIGKKRKSKAPPPPVESGDEPNEE